MKMNPYQIVWFILWGTLWTVYFVLDGFDLGAGSLLPFLTKKESERKELYHAIGPFWNGNEVWLITAGGATFAAFPRAYSVMFSSLYSPLLLLLFCLIFRGVSIEYRNKLESENWKRVWDFLFFAGSLLASFLLGVTFANLFRGLPVDENGIYRGSILTLLNPYGVMGGALFASMFATHGALWVTFRTNGELKVRAEKYGRRALMVTAFLIVAFWMYSIRETKIWVNFITEPLLFFFPAVSLLGISMAYIFLRKKAFLMAWVSSGAGVLGFSGWGISGIFPDIFPSSLNPAWSLNIVNSSSGVFTLKIMTVVAAVFVPVVLLYTIWTYKTFSYRITEEEIKDY